MRLFAGEVVIFGTERERRLYAPAILESRESSVFHSGAPAARAGSSNNGYRTHDSPGLVLTQPWHLAAAAATLRTAKCPLIHHPFYHHPLKSGFLMLQTLWIVPWSHVCSPMPHVTRSPPCSFCERRLRSTKVVMYLQQHC